MARIGRRGQAEKAGGCFGTKRLISASLANSAVILFLISHLCFSAAPAAAQEKRNLEDFFAPNDVPRLTQESPPSDTPPANTPPTPEVAIDNTPAREALPLPKFEHNIKLGHTVGIPSAVTLTTSEAELEKIRVLFVLDGRLLALPLQRKDSGAVFFATFPTPGFSLSYQFQFIHKDGLALVSENFTVDPHCSQRKLDRALSTANDFPLQASNLRRAAEVQQQSALFEYLAKAVTVLTQ